VERKKIQKIINANKIAAGEVVERPANVVKELIENRIDARAKEIKVIVKRAGKTLIQVIDDGIGIPPDEIEIAFESHTSSKIRSIADLAELSTLGFRGEALFSIATVGQVEIISRTEKNELGIQLVIEGGKFISKREVSCPIGTNIKVKNIFFNLPARQKFLKSDSTELGHISDILQRYSLAYPQLHFIYTHNDLTILNCPALNDLKTTVFHIYGKKNAKFMVPIDFNEENTSFKIHGVLGHPQISKKNRNYSSLFINRRYIISDVIYRAIQEAYKGVLMTNNYPFFILHLELNPSVVDFNVHPKKLNVRFEREKQVYNKVYNIIRSCVEENFIEKEASYISTDLNDFIEKDERSFSKIQKESREEKVKPIKEIREKKKETSEKLESEKKDEEGIESSVQLHLTDHATGAGTEKRQPPETYLREKYLDTNNFPQIRLISSTGQLSNNIYIVLEGRNEDKEPGMYILDQHAASERINKEYFERALDVAKNSKQQLISPLKIDVTPSEKFFLEENLGEIKKLGFDFDKFGGNTFILRTVPTIFGNVPNTSVIKDIIADIAYIGKDKTFSEVKEEIVNYLACHKSIRGGDDLSLTDIRNLIENLSRARDPFHCAHGRPTLKFISFKELDKIFKRIV